MSGLIVTSSLPGSSNNKNAYAQDHLIQCVISRSTFKIEVISGGINESFIKAVRCLDSSIQKIDVIFLGKIERLRKNINKLNKDTKNYNWKNQIKKLKNSIFDTPKAIRQQIKETNRSIKRVDRALWKELNKYIKEVYEIYDTIIEQISIKNSTEIKKIGIKRSSKAKNWEQLDIEIEHLELKRKYFSNLSTIEKVALFSREKFIDNFFVYLIAGILFYSVSFFYKMNFYN